MSAVLLLATLAIGQTPFDVARADALSTGTPLVIGVGCVPPPSGPTTMTWTVALVRQLAGYKAPCVVVQQPTGDKIHFVAMFPASVSQRQIHDALVWFEPPQTLSYTQGREEALRTGKDLVVGVGCDPPAGPWVSAYSKDPVWTDNPQWGPRHVVVSVNKGSYLMWARTYSPGEATPERIKAILSPPVKYNPASQPTFQERMNNQRRIRRQTSNLMLIAPRYRAVSGNC
jgi:hypothetical protein